MSRLLRIWRWLRDSVPLYSYRECSRHWLAGRDFGHREVGITRGPHGRFQRTPQ